MSTQTLLAGIKSRHGGGTTCDPAGGCDACRAVEIADLARDALQALQEWVSKRQYDEATFAAKIREGLGTTQR